MPETRDEGALDSQVETAVIRRVRNGDIEAYGQLVSAYMRRAYAIAYRILRHSQDAEDVVQDAFFTALERIDTFDIGRPFAPWFFRIVTNQTLNRRSANAVRATEALPDDATSSGQLEWHPAGGGDPQQDLEAGEVRERFRAAVAHLAPRPRLVVELADVDGFTPTQIASMLNVAPGTVRSYLHEARQYLRGALAALHGDD